jgi:hypothetical protein
MIENYEPRRDGMNETHLMPEAKERTLMEWSTAVQVIEWCVDEMLDKIAEYPDDYGPDRAEEVMEAFDRILRG